MIDRRHKQKTSLNTAYLLSNAMTNFERIRNAIFSLSTYTLHDLHPVAKLQSFDCWIHMTIGV